MSAAVIYRPSRRRDWRRFAVFLVVTLALGGAAWQLWRPSSALAPPIAKSSSDLVILSDNTGLPHSISSATWSVDWDRSDDDGSLEINFEGGIEDYSREESSDFPQSFLVGTVDVIDRVRGCGTEADIALLPPKLRSLLDEYRTEVAPSTTSPTLSNKIVRLDRGRDIDCQIAPGTSITRSSSSARISAPHIVLVSNGLDDFTRDLPSADREAPTLEIDLILPPLDWVRDYGQTELGKLNKESSSRTLEQVDGEPAFFTGDEVDASEVGSSLILYTNPIQQQYDQGTFFLSGVLLGGAAGSFMVALDVLVSRRD